MVRFFKVHYLVPPSVFLIGVYFHIELHDMNWKQTQYYVNYVEFGFVKRGLIGTIFYFIPTSDKTIAIYAFNIILGLALAIIFLTMYDSIKKRSADSWQIRMLFILVCFSPLAFIQLGFDIGRFDLASFLLLISAIFMARHKHFGSCAVLSVVGLSIHEAFAVFAVPLIACVILEDLNAPIENGDKAAFPWIKARGTYGAVATYLVVTVFFSFMLLFLGNDISASANLPGTGGRVWDRSILEVIIIGSFIDTLILIFFLACNFSLMFFFYRNNRKKPDAMFFAPLLCSVLFFLGHDYARWTSIIFSVSVIVIFYRVAASAWSPILFSTRKQLAVLICLSLPLGPVGINYFFPALRRAMTLVLG